LGTKLEQVWLRLGGDLCVDATARANLELLWGCLDHLPAGEQDVLGPALNAALEKLTARPDPSADSDFGVQLMTIHKAKGLEFEVVIVPDLQARCGQSSRKMLSWLERGIPSPDDSGEVTEFLVAPIQTKGGERGKAKKWVDGVYRHRELQEDRRILYVAATRARESLHLFARPSYKSEAGGGFSLCEPASSLLATAWPAFEDAVRAGFEKWKATRDAGPADVESIAASADGGLFIMPSPAKPTLLRRLPPGFRTDISSAKVSSGESKRAQTSSSNDVTVLPASPSRFYARHEGGLLSRAFGTAVHAFMEELARLREDHDWDAARSALQRFEPRVAALARAAGIAPLKASSIAAEALRQALDASNEAMGQWVLSPHTEAVSERRWTGLMNGELRTVQVDRVFRAGLEPRSEGQEAWWIVDYKTAHTDNPVPADSLPRLHVLFAQQIEAYAKILRNLHGQDAVLRAGLYYPRMQLLDWWKIEC
jgi:ATP-dependent exoDNAse (exonuclease V) beta subunit